MIQCVHMIRWYHQSQNLVPRYAHVFSALFCDVHVIKSNINVIMWFVYTYTGNLWPKLTVYRLYSPIMSHNWLEIIGVVGGWTDAISWGTALSRSRIQYNDINTASWLTVYKQIKRNARRNAYRNKNLQSINLKLIYELKKPKPF